MEYWGRGRYFFRLNFVAFLEENYLKQANTLGLEKFTNVWGRREGSVWYES